jgi:hypothetical protein
LTSAHIGRLRALVIARAGTGAHARAIVSVQPRRDDYPSTHNANVCAGHRYGRCPLAALHTPGAGVPAGKTPEPASFRRQRLTSVVNAGLPVAAGERAAGLWSTVRTKRSTSKADRQTASKPAPSPSSIAERHSASASGPKVDHRAAQHARSQFSLILERHSLAASRPGLIPERHSTVASRPGLIAERHGMAASWRF